MQKLKLSKETVQVLKNFNQINPMIYFKKGNEIATISPTKTIVANYVCSESFKSDFGIYRLDKLLSVLSFFTDPEIIIGDKFLTVKDDGRAAKIAFGEPAVLEYPKKLPTLTTVDAEFVVTLGELNDIIKASSVMELPFVAFESDSKNICLKALDLKNPNGDTYTIDLGEQPQDIGDGFTAIFNITNLKIIPANYHVQISAKGVAQFSSDKMTYWIALEKDSNFGG